MPDYLDARYNLGNALKELGRLDEAIVCYRFALCLKPDDAATHCSLGNALMKQGYPHEAIARNHKALWLNPELAEAHNDLGILYLLMGWLDIGWPEYEWRWRSKHLVKHRREFDAPRWNGEPLDGRTILLYAEQGMGDALQFCRYLRMLATQARVVLEIPRSLIKLLAPVSSTIDLVAKGDRLPPFDVHCPLLSLPLMFKTRADTIPPPFSDMLIDPDRLARWRDRLPEQGFRVGIVWQGNPSYKDDQDRSLPLSTYAPLAKLPGVRLISLQKRHGLDQLERLPPGMDVHTLGSDFDDGPDAFLDTVGVMFNLDIIVTIDSAVGHLAGSLGRPVWLALQKVPHWPWKLEGESTPWYPSMRLFRQTAHGDWASVFSHMAEELETRLTMAHDGTP
jgi:hypothetical protein